MKQNLFFIYLGVAILIFGCSVAKKVACISLYNESKKPEELLLLKNPNIYYFNFRNNSDTNRSHAYTIGLQRALKFYGKNNSLWERQFSLLKPDSMELAIFERYFMEKGIDKNNFYFLTVYSDNQDCLIFQGLLIKKKNVCSYVDLIRKMKEKEQVFIITPTSGKIELEDKNGIEKLIKESFFLIYQDGKYEYIPTGAGVLGKQKAVRRRNEA